jgi:5-(aminomethyl)-3-furanmethanol phosphate kinase
VILPTSNARPSPSATVVKLGGSLAESGRLAAVLRIVAGARVPVVVVPGGGTFADAVRVAQADLGFTDTVAHRMAILATHQTAHMLAALEPRLSPAETMAAIRRALAAGRIPVWLPWKLCARDQAIPADWSVTSDGLAARLAERLGRAPVVLVKSCTVPSGAGLDRLARAGTVDPTFVTIVERAGLSWRVLGAGDEAELAAVLKAQRQGRRRSAPQRAIARPK